MSPSAHVFSCAATTLALLGGLGPGGLAMAAEPRVTATVNRAQVQLGDALVLTVTIEGSRSLEPTLPPLADFDVRRRGSSTQMQIINGSMSTSVAYNYILKPRREGTLRLGPVTIRAGDREIASDPIEIRVTAASPVARSSEGSSRELFLETTVSNERPYVGEQVIYTLRFFRRVRLADARLELPEFEGLLATELGEQRDYNVSRNGVKYAVTELRRALFPQENGAHVLEGAQIDAQVIASTGRSRSPFDSFFGDGLLGRTQAEPRAVRSRPITLRVKPLPPSPPGFAGLVGKFQLKSQLSKTALAVGESTTLILEIEGPGHPQSISEPELGELTGFKVYPDRPSSTLRTQGAALSGTKTFRKSLVPLTPGTVMLPSVRVIFFNPETATYQTLTSERFEVTVTGSSEKEELRFAEFLRPEAGKVPVAVLADDIVPIHTDVSALRAPRPISLGWFAAALVVPPFCFFGFALGQRRRTQNTARDAERRRRNALKEARARLKGLQGQTATVKHLNDFAEQCSLTLRRYIGDLLNEEGAALTTSEVQAKLRHRGVSATLTDRTAGLLTQFEAIQYGGAEVASEELLRTLTTLLQDLRRELT